MVKLEYLMVYTNAGLPIYSKCFGNFCRSAFENPELLSGLLSAIEKIPPTIMDGAELKGIKMAYTSMRFSKTLPEGHTVVVGLSEDRPDVAKRVYEAVDSLLKQPRYQGVDWEVVTSELVHDFTRDLTQNYLVDAMHKFGAFADECPLGDQCPIHSDPIIGQKRRIWDVIRARYDAMKKMMQEKMTAAPKSEEEKGRFWGRLRTRLRTIFGGGGD